MSPKAQPFDPARLLKPPSADVAYLLDTITDKDQVVDLAHEHGLPLRDLPTNVVAPDPEQLRRLPAPDELTAMVEAGDATAGGLLQGLRDLGTSMRHHGQIQPVIVYADADPLRPDITHRLLNGHRRWSAAVLTGLPTIWAVEVPRPDPVSRMIRQFEENEKRTDFTDMERAWAVASLQRALVDQASGEIPWEVIEGQVGMSETRRKELMRLMRFEPEAQALIQRKGWSTWILRPLMQAVTGGDMRPSDATDLLRVLADETFVNQEGVQRLVSAHLHGDVGPSRQERRVTPREKPVVVRRMERMQRAIEQLRMQVMTVRNPEERAVWRAEADVLRRSMEALLRELES